MAAEVRLNASQPLRGAFVRSLLLDSLSAAPPFSKFELSNAWIEGELNLRAATLKVIARFVNCTFEDIILDDATIVGWEMIGGVARQINADRLTASGSLLISDGEIGPARQPRAVQVRLCGAKIHGNLDLRRANLEGKDEPNGRVALFADGASIDGNVLLSNGFKATGEVRLNGSKIFRNLDCTGAELDCSSGYSLSAAGARISGSVYLSRSEQGAAAPFISRGTVRFEGAKIEGNFECVGGQFTSLAFVNNNCTTGADLLAIKADGLEVASNLLLTSSEVHGVVSLDNAKIGGDVKCYRAFFDFPGEEPLRADGIAVTGGISFHGMRTNGILSFLKASFKQGFYSSEVTFHRDAGCKDWLRHDRGRPSVDELAESGRGVCGIYAPSAEVGGIFLWAGIIKTPPGDQPAMNPLWLFLPNCKADTVEDDEESWAVLDRFEITGCDYARIFDLSSDIRWRLDALDRQYAPLNYLGGGKAAVRALARGLGAWFWRPLTRLVIRWRRWRAAPPRPDADIGIAEAAKRFKPQPYVHFARVVRASGYEKAADHVLVRLQRNKTRYSDLNAFNQLGRWILDFVLRYGFSPFRPLFFLVGWALVSALWFEQAYYEKRIVPNRSGQVTLAAYTTPSFNPLLYAVDTLVPIVDLSQKKNWMVEPISTRTGLVHRRADADWWGLWRGLYGFPSLDPGGLIVFNTFFGWVMTTFFAAGISGLLRSGREG